MRPNPRLSLFAVLMGMSLASQAAAVSYDVDHSNNVTQTGFTAVNLSGVNGVTLTAVGSVTLDSRDRPTINTDGPGGDVANNDMWRDFVFANGSADVGDGLDINVAGLASKGLYQVRLWAFDEDSNGGRNMTWNGNALNLPSGPDPTSLHDQVVTFMAQADASGNLLLEGRVGAPIGSTHNVFVNGFSLKQVPLEYKIDIDSTRLSGSDTSGPLSTAPGFVSLDATNPADSNGASVTTQGITFSIGSADGSRIRVASGNANPNPLTGDFVFDDGTGEAVILFFGGAGDLPEGTWEVEVYAWDETSPIGGDLIVGLRTNNVETIIGSNFLGSPNAPIATFRFESNGLSAYDVFVRENNSNNRARLNAVVLRQVLPIPEPATGLLSLLALAGLGRRRRRLAA